MFCISTKDTNNMIAGKAYRIYETDDYLLCIGNDEWVNEDHVTIYNDNDIALILEAEFRKPHYEYTHWLRS